jgi:ribosomal protein L11 methylase PrmA
MALYPALEIHALDPELALALVDDFMPAAAEERDDGVRVYFTHARDRDHAATAVLGACPAAQVVALDVDDEDWARRSQADLRPVVVGRIEVVPSPRFQVPSPKSQVPSLRFQVASPRFQVPSPDTNGESPSHITIVIQPSMGFGTGHHATTRLCLLALQAIDLTGRTVLDVGTGSGILAIAAGRLGAAAIGIDHDADAIAAARENLALNAEVARVSFQLADLRDAALGAADVVCANLTGTLLASAAPVLKAAVHSGGTLIVSGLLEDEETLVRQALAPSTVWWRAAEQGWVALAARSPAAV